jgi:phosphoribosylformylglycinamidine cyclo-ligase
MTIIDYKAAGVNIEAGNEAVRRMKAHVEKTFSHEVLTGLGGFGSMYDLKPLMQNYQHPVMVQSIDGVGTKMIVARMMSQFETIGIDLVSATSNDIVVLGARPLTLLDYIASDRLDPNHIEALIKGMSEACCAHQIALVGGETAEMPDTYLKGEHDLVGIVTGVVEKDKAILGKDIKPGDLVMAFPSSGLHTNGYSLARKLFFDIKGYRVDSWVAELDCLLGDALLVPHRNYTNPILDLLGQEIAIKGMAHITGGGVLENIPRILPKDCAVEIRLNAAPVLPIFQLMAEIGKLETAEMYRTFNMGIGLVLIIAPEVLSALRTACDPAFPLYEIGQVVPGTSEVRLI